MITFASKLGGGIAPGESITNILLLALNNGVFEERLAAAYYLRLIKDTEVIKEIYQLVDRKKEKLYEEGLFTLWLFSIHNSKEWIFYIAPISEEVEFYFSNRFLWIRF